MHKLNELVFLFIIKLRVNKKIKKYEYLMSYVIIIFIKEKYIWMNIL